MSKTITDKFTIFNNIVWELKLNNLTKLVLICLYSYADKNGYCYPSYTTLCKRTGLSRPFIAKALKELESLELLRKETKFNNRYWLTPLTSKSGELVNAVNSISKPSLPKLVNPVNSNYTNELNQVTIPPCAKEEQEPTSVVSCMPKSKDKDTGVSLRKEKSLSDIDFLENLFNTFWSAYPKKIGKPDALKKFKVFYKKDKDVLIKIMIALDKYKNIIKKNKIEEKYIKQGSTFMNNWQDYYMLEEDKNPQTSHYSNIQKKLSEK